MWSIKVQGSLFPRYATILSIQSNVWNLYKDVKGRTTKKITFCNLSCIMIECCCRTRRNASKWVRIMERCVGVAVKGLRSQGSCLQKSLKYCRIAQNPSEFTEAVRIAWEFYGSHKVQFVIWLDWLRIASVMHFCEENCLMGLEEKTPLVS